MQRFVAYLYLSFVFSLTPADCKQKQPPMVVKTTKVIKQTIADQLEALGTTKAINSISLTPNTTEKVSKISFQDGQSVKKDDVLVELNQAAEQAQLRSAEAILSEAQAAYKRAEGLVKTKDISDATLKERKTDLLEAEAKVVELRAQIRDLQIIAPFDGQIGLSDIALGALVEPGDQIATLDDVSMLRVDFDVPAKFVGRILPGQTVNGKVEAYPNIIFEGQVTSTDSRVNPDSRSFVVRVIIPNAEMLLKPGMLMTGIVKYNIRDAIVIPAKAIVPLGLKTFVFQLDPKTKSVSRVEVVTGLRMTDRVEVLKGLSEGLVIVTEGQLKIREGSSVKPRADKSPFEDTIQNERVR